MHACLKAGTNEQSNNGELLIKWLSYVCITKRGWSLVKLVYTGKGFAIIIFLSSSIYTMLCWDIYTDMQRSHIIQMNTKPDTKFVQK